MSGFLIELDFASVPTAANIGNDPIEFNIGSLLAGGAIGPAGADYSVAALEAAFLDAEHRLVGTITLDTYGNPLSGTMLWLTSNQTGTYTADTINSTWHSVDAYHCTFTDSTTGFSTTITQPAVTRDSSGAVSYRPPFTYTNAPSTAALPGVTSLPHHASTHVLAGTDSLSPYFDPILTPQAVQTAGFTAAVGKYYPIDTTAGAIAVTLPTAPTDGSQIEFLVVAGGAANGLLSNMVTATCSGTDVIDVAGTTTFVLRQLFHGIRLQYQASTGFWFTVGKALSFTQLQAAFLPVTMALTGPITSTGTATAITSGPLNRLISSHFR